jgi:hypothetical protein
MRERKTLRAAKATAFYSKPNLQSGIGAFIGLMSLSFIWLIRAGAFLGNPVPKGSIPFHMQFTIFDLMECAGHDAALFGGLFIIGAIVALASPIGGVFQSAGLIGIAFRMDSMMFYGGRYFLGPGYLLAIVSTLLVLTSVSVIRTANDGRPARTISRFAALSPGSMSVFR